MPINVLEYLETSAANHPQKVVFSDPEHNITYRELVQQAKTIGSVLAAKLDGRTKRPVAVFIDRNITSLVAFMGIVYSGNCYVPIDPQMPAQRIASMLDTLQPDIVLLPGTVPASIKDLSIPGEAVHLPDVLTGAVDEARLARIRQNAIDTDPLYILFTSGSTGVPKGVIVCHRSVIDLIERFSVVFQFNDASIFGNQAPFDFDVSVKDIYSTLKHGASMHVIPKKEFSFPKLLIDVLNQQQINTIIWATSALRIIENFKALEKDLPRHLEKIMFSGEVMPNRVLNYWRSHLPDVQYVNLYGPTEITCNCTYFMVDRPFADSDMLPIGIPFLNTDILLLNEDNQPALPGEIGEICVRGTSLALGYYNNPMETSLAFCQNPLNPHYPETIYRTGDLGKHNDRGELLYLSRKDSQIKHMGHRIELGEIEVAVNALPIIEIGCCLYDHARETIVLYYQSPQPCDKEILLGLRDQLPRYMLPNKLVHYEKLPMNKNGKIDKVQLRGA